MSSINDDDKTRIISSSNKVNSNLDADKTVVNNTFEKSSPEEKNATFEKENNPQLDNKEKLKDKKESNSISATGFVAGAGAAAIAGAGLGTIYSEDIKEVFSDSSFAAPESPESELAETSNLTGEPTVSTVSGVAGTENFNSPGHTNEPIQGSVLEFSTHDNSGNTYTVSLTDTDGDGKMDSQTGTIHFVDGNTISYTETGENLNQVFGDVDSNNIFNTPSFSGSEHSNIASSHVYEVQAGDTLSDIAQHNNTSIDHIMELNPDIQNPDLIYANSEIVIPNNDAISNPYQDYNDFNSSNEAYVETALPEDGSSDANYEQVDWNSFSDEPVASDDSNYDDLLSQTDFNGYEDNSSNDFTSSEFV